MRVAVVTAFPPSKVTLNEYGYHLVKNFVQKEDVLELVLITDKTKEAKQLDFEKANKVTVKESWAFNSYRNIFSVCKTVWNEKPDVVFFNLQFMKFGDKKIPAALGLLLPMLITLMGFKTTVLLHNILEEVDLNQAGFTSNKFMQKVYNFIGETLTRIVLQADTVAVTIGKYVTVLSEKYKVTNVVQVPHGSFEVPKATNYSIPDGPKKIMTFGKFGTYKKVEILIDAVEQIRKTTNEPLEIVIAGTDSPNTPGYLESVKQKYAHVKGLTFTGYVEESDVPNIFNESTVVVFPYTSTTGSSGVLHQAGSYGKAVIMPNLGDLNLLVQEEGYNGEFFAPGDVNSLEEAIHNIIFNDTYRRELAMTNYRAASALSMDKIAEMYLSIFLEQKYAIPTHMNA